MGKLLIALGMAGVGIGLIGLSVEALPLAADGAVPAAGIACGGWFLGYATRLISED